MLKFISNFIIFFLLVFSSSTNACGQGCIIQADGSCVCPNPKPQP